MHNIEEWVRTGAIGVSLVAEAIGALIVAAALVIAFLRYTRGLIWRAQPFPKEHIRLDLGRALVLALEFLLAADIVRTAVAPTWEEIGKLAAIAAIRTVLNFFLQLEIAREERELDRFSGKDDAV